MKKTILLVVISCITLPILAQQNFKPGYVVLANGDTLRGETGLKSNLPDVPPGKLSGKGISLVYAYVLK